MSFLPAFGYQQRGAPQSVATRSRSFPTHPPRALTISAVLVLVAVAAGIGYHLWDTAHHVPAVELQYPGSVQLLHYNASREIIGKGELVGPREDRIYGIPAAQANKVSYHDILAWYHERILARGWTFQDALPPEQYVAGEDWSQGCERLSVRIWNPENAEPDFNDPKVYPITFELWQQNYCPRS